LCIPDDGPAPEMPNVPPRSECKPMKITHQPFPRELAGAFGAAALVFISDPGGRAVDRCTVLRAVYGLTVAEAQLARAIGDGAPLKLYAESHRISYETARTYLRRIFEKTGTRRQSELAGVVRALR
ncbi:MAG: helix-turn-helix transcriptional regulator, partial [Solimonas sp.]